MPERRTIYQLTNFTLDEAYIGMTAEDPRRRFEALKKDPPPSLTHWDFGAHRIETASIESFDASEADGVRFFSDYCASFRRASTAVIRCELDCDPEPQHDEKGTIVPCAMRCEQVRKDLKH